MRAEILKEAWAALRRNPVRSLLTMTGIVWGIAAVTLLIAYGSSFRLLMVSTFQNFSKSAVIAMPGQTSLQAGGERAGKRIRFELADLEAAEVQSPLIRKVCPETIRRLALQYGDQIASLQVRGVCPEYGDIRSQRALEGRWLTPEDQGDRRRVAFLGDWAKKKLFGGRPALGETVTIQGARFTVVGVMDKKLQFGNYFGPDDRSVFIPYSTAGDLWNTRYPSAAVIQPVGPMFEDRAAAQFRAALATRLGFQPQDNRAITTFGTSDMRPIIDGLTIGLQVLLLFIGALTLAIGGIGLMNILLVSVSERTREIGLRRALGARRSAILFQFLAEALAVTLAGGLVGIALSYGVAALLPPLPMLSQLFEDESGKGDLVLRIQPAVVLVSSGVLLLVGLLSGLAPALRAARLDPTEALRDE
jgi:putative ABC transport system permease protein